MDMDMDMDIDMQNLYRFLLLIVTLGKFEN